MTLLLLPLVAIAAVMAWGAGVRLRAVLTVAAAVTAILLLAALAMGVALVSDEDDEPNASPSRSVDESITVGSTDDSFAPPARPISGLDEGSVRFIAIGGLPANETAFVTQCVADAARCEPGFRVNADDDGSAAFLFEFSRCPAEQCTLVLTNDDGERLVATPLVFGRAVGEGALALDPRTQLEPGQEITVSLDGFETGRVTVTYCTPPGPIEPETCGAPAPEVVVSIGSDGRATADVPVYAGPVGRERSDCGRGHPCAIGVAGRPDVAVQPVAFAGSADARPGAPQVLTGLTLAVALLALAFALSRRGPWQPPDGDPFEGIVLDDPFKDLDADEPDRGDQPATSRRTNVSEPITVSSDT